MRFGPNGRILDWRRIRVPRLDATAMKPLLDASVRKSATEQLSVAQQPTGGETWHA